MACSNALVDLAEECFRQADHQDSAMVAAMLRAKGLQHLREARERRGTVAFNGSALTRRGADRRHCPRSVGTPRPAGASLH